ncbi:hypothetical protein IPA_00340 [Ignicoccus pacificus DSM 13166]|uniref:FAD/NAD(P)-binding domain-containing protein n=1 Tax=Ignicoccus pacificus DSM 13166 TaxID=940294 RepID=A0A977KBS4_9CREN|nr:hypothetical protein IPA_00340 [Ignicoccus pacificus DSM 13166]
MFLGAGPCTLVAIRRLREGPPEIQDQLDMTIITNSEWHYFPPLFADLALGEVTVDKIRAPAKNIAERYNAKFVLDEVTKVDPANRRVTTKGGKTFNYDYLFICLGVRNAPEVIPGLAEHGYHNYSLEGALRMREALAKFKGGDIVVLTPETPYRCGCYPFEIVGRIKYFAQRKNKNAKVHLVHVMTEQEILGAFKDVARQFMRLHKKMGIEYHTGKKVERVEKNKLIFQNGETMHYDLLIYVPPVRVPRPVEGVRELIANPKVMKTTFPEFRNPTYKEIFLPTDGALPSIGLPIAGIFMHAAAVAAADSLIAELTGVRATVPYPQQIVAVTDFGPTGYLVSFDVDDKGDGTATQKMYVTSINPMIKFMKLSFYLGWIESLK